MSDDKKYNGWTNYETWAVKLWLDNEESSYRYWQEVAQKHFDLALEDHPEYFSVSEAARYALADDLKNEIEDGSPLAESVTLYTDLLNAAISEVNWNEIANALLEEVEGTNDQGKKVTYEYEN